MEATSLQLASIFTGHRIFDVPFYQRSYVWKKEQWERFLQDMEFITEISKNYFLGSVILKQQNTTMGVSNEHRTIIDGQQRFTTIAIFCKALCLKTEDLDEFDHYFMVRDKKSKARSCALAHSFNDKKDFERVLNLTEDKPIADAGDSCILQAYNYFQEHIDVNKVDFDSLLRNITLIDIELQPDDDEQAIFDTINSLGVRLTTAELLKNYFFTEASVEEYKNLWVPIFEKDQEVFNYWNSDITVGRSNRNNIDAFFWAFLNVKIQDKRIGVDNEHKMIYRKMNSIFASYKDLVSTYGIDKKELYQEVMEYADLYAKNIHPDIIDSDIPSSFCVERINFIIFTLDCSTMIPYILYILKNVKDEDERNEIFGYLESYVVRRAICRSENKNFSDLFSEMLIGNEVKSFEDLRNFLENRSDFALEFPKDSKVMESFRNVMQSNNKRALAILYLMESRLRHNQPHATKLLAFSDYTLEHLMPKKYEKNWPLNKNYDVDMRKKMISTLGNMAMLPQKLNSSVSNADWETKKSGKKNRYGLSYFASDLVTLKDAVKCEKWSEETIIERADWLGKITCKIWPSYEPDVDYEDFDLTAETKLNSNDTKTKSKTKTKKKAKTQDKTKYSFDGENFMSKSEFVVTLVRKYMEINPQATYMELKQKFHDGLCATGFKFKGFLCTEEEYNKWDNKDKEKRYLPNAENHRQISSDGIVFFVNTQWVKEAMDKLVNLAKTLGLEVYTKVKA